MAGYNKVILMGNLTRDPALRTLPGSETSVCDFALAVNRQWKDAAGEAREDVLFIDCAAFGKVGQLIGERLTKGRPIHVEGRLKLDRWEQDGQARSKIRVVVEQFRFVDRKPVGEQPAAAEAPDRPAKQPRKGARKPRAAATPAPAEPVGVAVTDDAPF